MILFKLNRSKIKMETKSNTQRRGILRVGRIKNASETIKLPGFTSIVVMTTSSKFGMLSPFQLKTKDGIIIENKWQFMKVYEKVPETTQYYSRFNKTIIWDYHEEQHVDEKGNILPEYYNWQEQGFKSKLINWMEVFVQKQKTSIPFFISI
jgi:hypothetical protein